MNTLAHSHKLALGTAQFGLKYGLANMSDKVPSDMVAQLLKIASACDITMLDTAIAYGDSEQVLGRYNLTKFEIVSKLPAVPSDCSNVEEWVLEQTIASLKRLKTNKLHDLLLHKPAQLLGTNGEKIYKSILKLKEQGMVDQIGVSVYGPDELSELIKRFDFDVIQAPMNIFDRRMENTGMLKQLKKAGAAIHIRSVFLQGLLLMPSEKIPVYFAPWASLIKQYHQWLNQQGISPLQACLSYLNQHSDIDKIVVGVDDIWQLKQIIAAINTPSIGIPDFLQSVDEGLINPSRWQL
ncbi:MULTISPECIES: aldo/keto reductase [unclassified Psychrobacter]|uniref:aldo/keto reductase n=1 Tax=unclassified Psychrobacter TaxID=196806 RepID=UPI0025EBFE55|nr:MULTISPECIES: aldo/keto reductase [unclassified Psychrobacter]